MNSTHNFSPETIDIHVRGASRKRFVIDGDPNKVIELNTADLSIVERFRNNLPKLQALEAKANKINADGLVNDDGFDDKSTEKFIKELNDCNQEMKQLLNDIFDEDVADKCSPRGGTMYDPVDGEPRYMVIIADLSAAYQNDLSAEMKKVAKKREQHTAKYTKKK